jgi:hypothetical protein
MNLDPAWRLSKTKPAHRGLCLSSFSNWLV